MKNDIYTIKSFFGLKHPVSGLLHLLGFLLSISGLIWLLMSADRSRTSFYFLSAYIFTVSMALLYLSSTSYHLVNASEKVTKILRRIDHSMIFIFIAGTCTPFCLTFPSDLMKTLSMILIWSIALTGIFLSTLLSHRSRWLRVGSYLLMGGVGALIAIKIHALLSPESFQWIAIGGAAYILGSFVYALKWPNPFPSHFGFHEIWHIFVLVGSGCHFLAVQTHLKWAFT